MKVSVIIPALNEAENIIASVMSVKNQPGDFEIIVVDGGSHDNTIELVRPHARVLISQRGRAIQMNAGARQANGDVLLFLHADGRLRPDALSHLRLALADPRIVGGTFTLQFDSDKFLLKLYAFFTRFKFRYFHYGDQGIFVRRSIFEQLEGFKEIPLMEDLDLFRRLHRMGQVALVKLPVLTSARRFLKYGVLRQQLLNIFLVILYLIGMKPETLAKWYSMNSPLTPSTSNSSTGPMRESGPQPRGDLTI